MAFWHRLLIGVLWEQENLWVTIFLTNFDKLGKNCIVIANFWKALAIASRCYRQTSTLKMIIKKQTLLVLYQYL